MAVEGKCNCGAIKVSIDDKVAKETAPMFCRCSNCRRQSGAFGTAVTLFPDAAVTISGNPKDYEDKTTDSGTVLHRLFCGDCGCPIMSTTSLMPGRKIIKMGLFDKIQKPTIELYCKNKQEWETLINGSVQLQAGS